MKHKMWTKFFNLSSANFSAQPILYFVYISYGGRLLGRDTRGMFMIQTDRTNY